MGVGVLVGGNQATIAVGEMVIVGVGVSPNTMIGVGAGWQALRKNGTENTPVKKRIRIRKAEMTSSFTIRLRESNQQNAIQTL
jgi:hypothetical protein